MDRKDEKLNSRKVGGISRIDYLSPGFDKGLIDLTYEWFRIEEVVFVVWSGGVISLKDYNKLRAKRIKDAKAELREIKNAQIGLPKEEHSVLENVSELKERVENEIFKEVVRDLARAIPELKDKEGNIIKTYIVAAPSPTYDGKLGEEIAYQLSRIRKDIACWNRRDQFELKSFHGKYPEQKFACALPIKTGYRSKYFSTRFDRLVEDEERRITGPKPDLWISDVGGISLYRPPGELRRPRISLPALHVVQYIETAENQIGARIVEFFPDNSPHVVHTFSFKDFASNKRLMIPDPENADEVQRGILAVLRSKEPQKLGMLADKLPWTEENIEDAIKRYQEAHFAPPIIRYRESEKYDIDPTWLQWQSPYTLPSKKELKRDAILGFGCLHAGYCTTQYNYFVKKVPDLILENEIDTLVGAGDYIAGLKHSLHLRGEVYGGLNYTDQERVAAELICEVVVNVFKERFNQALKRPWIGAITGKRLRKLTDECLLKFLYWEGNHDKWCKENGVDTLSHFNDRLPILIEEGLESYLRGKKFPLRDLFDTNIKKIVREHIVFAEEHVLPSGLNLGINHPEMARMQTSSGRAQQTLTFRSNCQIEVLANFHTAIETQEWEYDLGQRVAMQCGTLVSGTEFEGGKLKKCDTGVGVAKIYSKDGRIFLVESFFDSLTKGFELLNKKEPLYTLLSRIRSGSSKK